MPGYAEYTAEFIGTYMLVFTVGCNVLGKTPVWAGVSIACVLMVAIYALGNISGANFNPAVSLSLAVSKAMRGPGIDWSKFAGYALVQLFAGVLASFSYAILFWNAFNLSPSKGFGWLSAGLCELLYTCMLCFVVLNVAGARKWAENRDSNDYYGLAIGFVIIAGAYGAGVVSGGAFNPAVAFGIDTSSALIPGWSLVYALFEALGACLAVILFRLVRPGDFGRDPNPTAPPSLLSRLVSEFIGTFYLVLTVGLNVLGNSPAGAFSIAASLMCMIYALGDISGAHFNPAVTVAVRLTGGLPADKTTDGRVKQSSNAVAAFYVLAQLLGAILAGITYMMIFLGHTFPLGPMPGYKWGHVAVAEIVFTFTLCYVVLCTAVHDCTHSDTMFGLAIGSCVTVGGFAIGSISGGSLNPAVSFGISVSRAFAGKTTHHLAKACIYTVFEVIGALVAVAALNLTHPKMKSDSKESGRLKSNENLA